MNGKEMSEDCNNQGYKVLGKGKLAGYRFEYNGHSNRWDGPAGDVVKSGADESVWGVLYEIDKNCRSCLDESEGYQEDRVISKNTYIPIEVTIVFSNSKSKEEQTREILAFTYVHVNTGKKKELNCEYKKVVITGARNFDLPEDYISSYLDVECRSALQNKN